MGERLFYIVLGIAIAWFGYQIIRLGSGYSALHEVPEATVLGADADTADLTVVEFMDYSCPFCREVHGTITEAIRRDGHVRFIPRPLPSDDEYASHAALLAYTAAEQGKFLEMHNALIKNYRVVDEGVMRQLADEAGIDMEKFQKDYEAKIGEKAVIDNGKTFKALGRSTFPLFIIGEKLFYVPEGRMPTVDDFLRMFAEARAMDKK